MPAVCMAGSSFIATHRLLGRSIRHRMVLRDALKELKMRLAQTRTCPFSEGFMIVIYKRKVKKKALQTVPTMC